jgi:hypothetical protein
MVTITGIKRNSWFELFVKDGVWPTISRRLCCTALLWAESRFPEEWFTNGKVDDKEKYHE